MALAAVIGSHGGIGAALSDALDKRSAYSRVLRISRSKHADIQLDIADEDSIEKAALAVSEQNDELTMCVISTGILHNGENGPEKGLKQLEGEWMAKNFQINTIGPALVAKHFLPLMPRNKAFHFAAISARVGSISDNRLGGWHSYRASKAALNMVIRNLAIEYGRWNDAAVIAALHPGTVDSRLSEPFQGNVPQNKLFTPEYSAKQMIDVLTSLKGENSGKIFAWDGKEITP